MIPTSFIVLDAFPLTHTGKIDRQSLPLPDHTEFKRKEVIVPPRDRVEVQLMHIWQDILGFSPVGVTNSFFELGGTSFSAVRLIMQIQKNFDHNIPLSILLQNPTI